MARYARFCASSIVLAAGLAIAAPVDAQTTPLYTAAIPFDFGDDEIKSTARVKLDDVATRLLGNRYRAEITGYADGALQTEMEDRRLSLRRAISARRYLVGKGINENRLGVFALGKAGAGNIGVRINILAAP